MSESAGNKSRSRRVTERAVSRRRFMAHSAALALLAARPRTLAAHQAPSGKYRVAVIGHTGRGNYGHGLDKVWLGVPGVEIVAVADAHEQGLAAALGRLGVAKGYRDYRRMLDEVKPDLVAVAPRWIDQHRDMVVAAAERGARGIYFEKPMCRTLAEADEMIAACEKNHVKAAVSHQTRYSPKLTIVRELIASGRLGRVLEFRARGKEDGRGGGEDLWVLGTHVLDLVHSLGGEPRWCFGSVFQEGRPIRPGDVAEGNEGIGPLAGDEVHALYRLAPDAGLPTPSQPVRTVLGGPSAGSVPRSPDRPQRPARPGGGPVAYFDSVRNARGNPSRFGLRIFGSQGVIQIGTGYLPPAYYLPDSSWSPGQSGKAWIPISSAGVGVPEPLEDGGLDAGNRLAARDLIASIEEDRQPESSIYAARAATEMIVAVFESQRVGGPVKLPLANRQNPLTMLR